jgi:DNA primase
LGNHKDFDIDEHRLKLRALVDIVTYVGKHVKLRRDGGNFIAKCPLHKDPRDQELPTFSINPNRQNFKCTWCGKGGDITNFVMNYEDKEFLDAIILLSKHADITIPKKSQLEKIKKRWKKSYSEEMRQLGLEVRLDVHIKKNVPHEILQNEYSADYLIVLNNAMTTFFFKLELLYDDLKLNYNQRVSHEMTQHILKEMAPYILRTPGMSTRMYQKKKLEELLRIRESIVESAVTDFKKPWFELEKRGIVEFETHPTSPYEIRIISMMLKRPHTIEYFRKNLQEDWFLNRACKTMFKFLCDKTTSDTFDYTYQAPGDEAPLLEKAFKQNIPKEVALYAEGQGLGAKEYELNTLYSLVKVLSIQFRSNELRMLLEESYLEHQLVEFEDENFENGKVISSSWGGLSSNRGFYSFIENMVPESEVYNAYFALFRTYMDVQEGFTDKLRTDYVKLERRRWAREQRRLEKEKNTEQKTLFDTPPEEPEEPEDANGLLF